MPKEGVGPSSLAGHDFESCVYTVPPLRQVGFYDRIIPVFLAMEN